MKYKYLIEIAGALMLARWKQTLVAAIGVTFSIALFVALLGFMEGLNNLLDGIVLNRTPHIRLYNDIKPSQQQPIDLSEKYKNYHNYISSIKPANTRIEIYNAQQIINKLKKDDRVEGVAAKIINFDKEIRQFLHSEIKSYLRSVNSQSQRQDIELFIPKGRSEERRVGKD